VRASVGIYRHDPRGFGAAFQLSTSASVGVTATVRYTDMALAVLEQTFQLGASVSVGVRVRARVRVTVRVRYTDMALAVSEHPFQLHLLMSLVRTHQSSGSEYMGHTAMR